MYQVLAEWNFNQVIKIAFKLALKLSRKPSEIYEYLEMHGKT